jgi:hypothetical protein
MHLTKGTPRTRLQRPNSVALGEVLDAANKASAASTKPQTRRAERYYKVEAASGRVSPEDAAAGEVAGARPVSPGVKDEKKRLSLGGFKELAKSKGEGEGKREKLAKWGSTG